MRQWIFFLFFILQTGCHRDFSYDYLMLHPNELHKFFNQCQLKQDLSMCDTVQHAMGDFSALVNEQALDPQQFGIRIIHAQQRLVNLLEDFKLAKHEGHHDKIVLAEEAYSDQQKQLQILYLVVANAFYGS